MAQKPQQGTGRKVMVTIVCVILALALMLPVAGLGVASCAGPL
jgi:hypothetical protein